MILSKIISRILRSKATTHTKNSLQLFSAGFLALSVVEGFVWISIASFLCSCASHKQIQTVPIETIRKDTLYISKEKYDSIYIFQDKYTDRSKDTLLIKETNIEYRYKLLRDTIKEVRIDSIPYEVRITETIEVPRKLTWYDHTARATFWLLIGFILLCLYRRFHKP